MRAQYASTVDCSLLTAAAAGCESCVNGGKVSSDLAAGRIDRLAFGRHTYEALPTQ